MGETTELPEHVTEPLLDRVTRGTTDSEYQYVVERRAAQGESPAPRRPGRTAAVVAAVFGLMIVVAGVQTSRTAATTEEGRQELIRQISLARDDLRTAQEEVAELREENAQLSQTDQELAQTQTTLSGNLLQTRGRAGFAPVTGPGVRVRAGDAPDGSDEGRIRDEDLALLVDGLWAAGAEAISINGHRLTSISGIRSAGRAILVNSRPLKPPYTILAVGDNDTMQSLFTESASGVEWMSLRSAFGFEFEMVNDDNLSLPGNRRPQLRSAEVLGKSSMKEATP